MVCVVLERYKQPTFQKSFWAFTESRFFPPRCPPGCVAVLWGQQCSQLFCSRVPVVAQAGNPQDTKVSPPSFGGFCSPEAFRVLESQCSCLCWAHIWDTQYLSWFASRSVLLAVLCRGVTLPETGSIHQYCMCSSPGRISVENSSK